MSVYSNPVHVFGAVRTSVPVDLKNCTMAKITDDLTLWLDVSGTAIAVTAAASPRDGDPINPEDSCYQDFGAYQRIGNLITGDGSALSLLFTTNDITTTFRLGYLDVNSIKRGEQVKFSSNKIPSGFAVMNAPMATVYVGGSNVYDMAQAWMAMCLLYETRVVYFDMLLRIEVIVALVAAARTLSLEKDFALLGPGTKLHRLLPGPMQHCSLYRHPNVTKRVLELSELTMYAALDAKTKWSCCKSLPMMYDLASQRAYSVDLPHPKPRKPKYGWCAKRLPRAISSCDVTLMTNTYTLACTCTKIIRIISMNAPT